MIWSNATKAKRVYLSDIACTWTLFIFTYNEMKEKQNGLIINDKYFYIVRHS